MSFNIPASWKSKPKLLSDMLTPIPTPPSSPQIYIAELSPDIGLRNGRLSNHVGSAFTMTYVINQEVLENSMTREILTKSLLGGWSTLNNKKNAPYKHPYMPGMYAKDIVEVQPFELQDSLDSQNWSTYNLCKITVSFESLNYPVDATKGSGDDYNPNWVEWKSVSSSNRASVPFGWYVFDDFPWPATFGNWITQPYSNIQATIYNCTFKMVYGNVAQTANLIPFFSPNVGKVNSTTFAGCGIEYLLLDTFEVQPYTDWLGNRLYNVRLNFIYNGWGWNTSLNPAGNPGKIHFVLGGARPFKSFDFKTLFNGLNP